MEAGKRRQRHLPSFPALVAVTMALAAHARGAVAAQPDLVVESVAHSPAAPVRGDTVTFTVIVRNQGDAHVNGFSVKFYFDSATMPTASGYGDKRVSIGILPAGAAMAVGFSLLPPLDAGAFKAWAYADHFEHVVESDESNNVGPVGGHDWSVIVSPEPDLLVESIVTDPIHAMTAGVPGTFTALVTNVGGSDAGAFNVGFWSDLNSPPDIDDVPDDNLDVASLAAGASTSLDFPLTAPRAGEFQAYACADHQSGGEITESIETNNVAFHGWRAVTPDAYEPDDDFASAQPIADEDIQIHSIHVLGDTDFVVFNLDTTGGVAITLRDSWAISSSVDAFLYNDAFEVIQTNGFGDEDIYSSELQAGTYYLGIGVMMPQPPFGDYPIDFALAEIDAYEPDDSFEEASVITADVPQTRSIHWVNDNDHLMLSSP